jgi:hypothetical protein
MNDLDRTTLSAPLPTLTEPAPARPAPAAFEEVYLDCRDAKAVASAITDWSCAGPGDRHSRGWACVLEARRLSAAASAVSEQTLEPVLSHLNAARRPP